jgi:hypothetical protein
VLSQATIVRETLPGLRPAASKPPGTFAVTNEFTRNATWDVAGATNGTETLAADGDTGIDIYSLTGVTLKTLPAGQLFCSGSPQLPACSGGTPFPCDGRSAWDPMSQRWILSFLWCSGKPPNITFLGVSKTSDPTGAWYVYQFPGCGVNDTSNADQPHLGFSDQWIIVTTGACSSQQNGIAVFDKANLYSGGAITLSKNWFLFTDPAGLGYDNPVATYTPMPSHDAFLAVAGIGTNGHATMSFGYVTGKTDSPTYSPQKYVVDTGVPANGNSTVDAPGCPACLGDLANTWVHSAFGYNFIHGTPYILAAAVFGNPKAANSTEVVATAFDVNTHVPISLGVVGGAGQGALSAQIALPSVASTSFNQALIVYGYSDDTFYPGLKAIDWNIDSNVVASNNVVQEGTFTPTSACTVMNRWLDFDDALTPIPGTKNYVFAGHVAEHNPNNPNQCSVPQYENATQWGTITP